MFLRDSRRLGDWNLRCKPKKCDRSCQYQREQLYGCPWEKSRTSMSSFAHLCSSMPYLWTAGSVLLLVSFNRSSALMPSFTVQTLSLPFVTVDFLLFFRRSANSHRWTTREREIATFLSSSRQCRLIVLTILSSSAKTNNVLGVFLHGENNLHTAREREREVSLQSGSMLDKLKFCPSEVSW